MFDFIGLDVRLLTASVDLVGYLFDVARVEISLALLRLFHEL